MIDPLINAHNGVFDTVLAAFLTHLRQDYSAIVHAAHVLFYYLAGIQWVSTALWFTLSEGLTTGVIKAMQSLVVLGLFYTLIDKGGEYIPIMVNGFIHTGSLATGMHALSPSDIMAQGLDVSLGMVRQFNHLGWIHHPFSCLLACTLSVAIVLLYALLAAEVSIVMIKSYALVSLSGVFFAFGAHHFLRPITLQFTKACIGVGLQCLTLYLLMGVGMQLGQDWQTLIHQAATQQALQPFFIIFSGVVIYYMVIKTIPPFIAGLACGADFSSRGESTIAAAVSAGASLTQGGMMATNSTVSSARMATQMTQTAKHSAATFRHHRQQGASLSRATGNTAKAVSQAAMATAHHHLSQSKHGHGTGVRDRLAQRLAQETAKAQQKNTPP